MGYPEQFQNLREARGLTREQLAMRADCHRNTVINLESGRPVKFTTIKHLMARMGYGEESEEMRLLALLWLESVTGFQISAAEMPRLQSRRTNHMQDLHAEVVRRGLEQDEVELLVFAARNRKVLSALRAIRDLARDPV